MRQRQNLGFCLVQLFSTLILCVSFVISTQGQQVFTHKATTSSIDNHMTVLDNSATNGKPDAILFITERFSGTYTKYQTGVWYNKNKQKWTIYREDKLAMPKNATFNVLVMQPSKYAFTHKATASNIKGHYTILDIPIYTGISSEQLIVTQNWKAAYNESPIGVWYDTNIKKWTVYNQDKKPMKQGVTFNILQLEFIKNDILPNAQVSRCCFSEGHFNYGFYTKYAGQNAHLFVTYNYGNGPYNTHVPAVWFDKSKNKWAVYNKDKAKLPFKWSTHNQLYPNYNVLALKATSNEDDGEVFDHIATTSNIEKHMTILDNSATNKRPNALLFVTPLDRSNGVKQLGVWYNQQKQKWCIYQEDKTIIPPRNTYRIHVQQASDRAFKHTVTAETLKEDRKPYMTVIDHAACNGRQDVYLEITQVWDDRSEVYNSHIVKPYFDKGLSKWVIRTKSLASLPKGLVFNVLVKEYGMRY